MDSSKLLEAEQRQDWVLLIIAPWPQGKVSVSGINIGGSNIVTTSSARNLGVIFDSGMTMEKQVNNICKSAMANLHNVTDIRQSLTQEALEKLVHALVTSRLDSNNAMLYGLPGVLLDRIQRVQNTAARVMCHSNESSASILKKLHWLPVHQRRIEYKVLLVLAPSHITDQLIVRWPQTSLRSSQSLLLEIPRTK